MLGNAGMRALVLTVVGYAVLLSYTWPLGFAPVISLESLPMVLLGFSLILLTAVILLWLLFAPLSLAKDPVFLYAIFFDNPRGDHTERHRARVMRLPVFAFTRSVVEAVGYVSFLQTCWGLLLIILISAYLWYQLASYVRNPMLALGCMPVLWLAYNALSSLIFATSLRKAMFPALGVFICFIVVPMLLPESVENFPRISFHPNPLVAEALRMISAGGGMPAEINPLATNSHADKGTLLFFDGRKAWYWECDQQRALFVSEVSSLRVGGDGCGMETVQRRGPQ